ncbi:MAG: hypothetical protein H0U59_05210 [Gemmatimonadaceae bacterium]|nr:hypothetical protein [Gemmatimonadaceae bacterium]
MTRKVNMNTQISIDQDRLNELGAEMAHGLHDCRRDTRNNVLAEIRSRLREYANVGSIDPHTVHEWIDELWFREEGETRGAP